MPLGNIFKSNQEIEADEKRLQKRELRDANRSCDKIQADLDRQAKDLEIQIKAAASKNDTALMKTLAKQLIRIRNEKTRAVGAKSKIISIATQTASMQTNNKLAQVISTSTAALSRINQHTKPDQLAKQLNQFQAESTKIDMNEEAFEDMFDEIFAVESDDADSIVNQVLDEIAIDTNRTLAKLPSTSNHAPISDSLTANEKVSALKLSKGN